MNNEKYHIVGVMSGTSLDGIDLLYCSFRKAEKWDFEMHRAETIPYPEHWKKRLQQAVYLFERELRILNVDYTKYIAEVIKRFIEKFDEIPAPDSYRDGGISAVCSHGHTVLHQPQKGITLQIGNLPEIAELLGETVVCNFRVQDVALGGQGAPLVPIGDELLFSEYDYCLNLGGFANVSANQNGKRTAYDICPVNIVLNPLAERLGFPYDDKGKIASQGKLIPGLLKKLNDLSFYRQNPPKSLGLEWVLHNVFPLLKNNTYKTEDLLHTFTEHIAIQLADGFSGNSTVLVTGGGAYNNYLLERIRAQKALKIILPDKWLIEYKEALIFGLLGVLKLRNEINCLASVTGAEKDHSSGVVYQKKS